MIKVIGFDLGGVYLTDCWSKIVRKKIANKFNVPLDILEKRNEKFVDKITEGKISEDDFLNKLFSGFNLNIKEVKDYIRELNKVIFPEMLSLMKKLKKNYFLVLMNNEGKEWNEFRIKRFHLNEIFEKIFSSCIIGKMKPKREYFEIVVEQLNIKPQELLFIDNEEPNIKSASLLGIKTILFQNPDQLKKDLLKFDILF